MQELMLITLTDRQVIRSTVKRMLRTLGRGAHRLSRLVGWQGGTSKFEINWRPREGFWWLHDPARPPPSSATAPSSCS